MPTRQDWLLFLIAGSGPGDRWLDRLQLLTGVHTLQEAMSIPELDYSFTQGPFGVGVPFTWGLYRDISILEDQGLIYEHSDAISYGATTAGREYIGKMSFSEQMKQKVREIREGLNTGEGLGPRIAASAIGNPA